MMGMAISLDDWRLAASSDDEFLQHQLGRYTLVDEAARSSLPSTRDASMCPYSPEDVRILGAVGRRRWSSHHALCREA